jgi:hypothetical protein
LVATLRLQRAIAGAPTRCLDRRADFADFGLSDIPGCETSGTAHMQDAWGSHKSSPPSHWPERPQVDSSCPTSRSTSQYHTEPQRCCMIQQPHMKHHRRISTSAPPRLRKSTFVGRASNQASQAPPVRTPIVEAVRNDWPEPFAVLGLHYASEQMPLQLRYVLPELPASVGVVTSLFARLRIPSARDKFRYPLLRLRCTKDDGSWWYGTAVGRFR